MIAIFKVRSGFELSVLDELGGETPATEQKTNFAHITSNMLRYEER